MEKMKTPNVPKVLVEEEAEVVLEEVPEEVEVEQEVVLKV